MTKVWLVMFEPPWDGGCVLSAWSTRDAADAELSRVDGEENAACLKAWPDKPPPRTYNTVHGFDIDPERLR